MISAVLPRLVSIFTALFFVTLIASVSPAQERGARQTAANGAATVELIEAQEAVVKQLAAEVDELESAMRADARDDAALVEVRNALDDAGRVLGTSSAAFGPRLDEINRRLEQIGPPPENGAAEPEGLTQERTSLAQEKAAINAVLGEIEKQELRISRLTNEITQIRRELFFQPADQTLQHPSGA